MLSGGGAGEIEAAVEEADDAVADALRYAESAPFPDVADALRDVV